MTETGAVDPGSELDHAAHVLEHAAAQLRREAEMLEAAASRLRGQARQWRWDLQHNTTRMTTS